MRYEVLGARGGLGGLSLFEDEDMMIRLSDDWIGLDGGYDMMYMLAVIRLVRELGR